MPRTISNSSPLAGRPRSPARQQEIVDDLRRQIVVGDLAPASKMPTRRELSLAYSASTRTVQDALDNLISDGFVEAYGPKGTFVSERPPHLSKYALVFTAALDTNRFWSALHNDALRRRREQVQNIEVWHHIDGHADNEDCRRLVDEVKRHRVAGLIFIGDSHLLNDTPLMEEPNVPRVSITSKLKRANVSVVRPDDANFRRRALDHLVSKGCKRIALILPENEKDDNAAAWHAEAAERGLNTRPYWTQSVDPRSGHCAKNIAHLLFNPLQSELPDGLVIADDNFVEPATTGLLNAGVNLGRDLNTVVHCNFPWPTQSVIPARRLGYAASTMIDACIRAIDQQRINPNVATTELIPAMFEDELGG